MYLAYVENIWDGLSWKYEFGSYYNFIPAKQFAELGKCIRVTMLSIGLLIDRSRRSVGWNVLLQGIIRKLKLFIDNR